MKDQCSSQVLRNKDMHPYSPQDVKLKDFISMIAYKKKNHKTEVCLFLVKVS